MLVAQANLYAIWPAFAVPLLVLAAFDVPRRHNNIWQVILFLAILFPAIHNPIDMHICGYYTATPNCGKKDYMACVLLSLSVALSRPGARA